MTELYKKTYGIPIESCSDALLVADIGGTNSNFGIFKLYHHEYRMLFSVHAKSQTVTDFTDLIEQVVLYCKEKYSISITQACFAVAGPVIPGASCVKPTNLSIIIDVQQIKAICSLKNVWLVNDFEVIGYGIAQVKKSDLILVHAGTFYSRAQQAIVGAGTGLGTCIMYWNHEAQMYVPVVSEGGHSDFCPHTQDEFDFLQWILKKEQRTNPVSWEDVLSGKGISRIYNFFASIDTKRINTFYAPPQPDEIFASRMHDQYSQKTFEWYAAFYGRCIKNFALESLALNGIYIAGGIASKNVDLFKTSFFLDEFLNNHQHHELLASIPIYVIADYNVSLYGAAEFIKHSKEIIK